MTTSLAEPAVRAAYQHCQQVTRTQARNFAYGIMLLPPGKREALSAVYAFARRIDDIGDGPLPAAEKLAALAQARAVVAALCSGEPPPADDQVLVALADAAARYPIPLAAFGELIDGCEADVTGARYATFGELEHYCRCVAGSIGRLSLGVFGSREPGNGRVYLPGEDLEAFGVRLAPGMAVRPDERLISLVRFEAQRALGWYAAGLRLIPLLDRRSAASAGAMAGIYLRLLERIRRMPAAALARRMSLPAAAKAAVAVRALAGLRQRLPADAPPASVPALAGGSRGTSGNRGTGGAAGTSEASGTGEVIR